MRTFDSDGYGGTPGGGGGGSGSQRPMRLPDGVAESAADAKLATLIDVVPVQQVSGFDTVEYLRAAHRLATHYHAVFLQALLETGLRLPGPDDQINRAEVPGDFAAEEARAALVWSRSRAETTFSRAYEMFVQNPAIGAALLDATLDEPRAAAFCQWTRGLADEHSARIIDELLPIAGTMTVGQLIDRIKRMAIALDPVWAERRYNDAVRERRVELRQNPDGTADLAGRDLPTDRAKTGADRIHALAKSCKTAGDGRRIDAIRADLFLGMLDGLYQHMTDQQIIDHVLANPVADDPTDNEDGPTDDDPRTGGDADNTPPGSDNGGGHPGRGNGGTGNGSGGNPGNNSHRTPAEPGHSGTPSSGPAGDATPSGGPADDVDGVGRRPDGTHSTSAGKHGDATSEPASGSYTSPWNVAELRAELATLLGLDQHPAELPGLGYIPAAVARPLAARMASAEWRFVICTPDGVPICSGITTRRPASRRDARRDHERGGILELPLTTAQLDQLAAAVASGQYPDWADVITDITDRYHRGIVDAGSGTTATASAAGAHNSVGCAQAAHDARRRLARAGLRRWVEVRDRYCLHPTCRMPAAQTDQDHRVDYANGGPTTDTNLDSHCRHDHRLQHDGGWQLYRPPGSNPLTGPIIWVSPLGHQYESRPPPVVQPYPEPGHYYPGHDTLPEWFTKLAEQAKAAQRPTRTAGGTTATDGESISQPRRATSEYAEHPPF